MVLVSKHGSENPAYFRAKYITVDGFVHCLVASTEGISCEASIAISFFNHYLISNPEINFQAILQEFSNIPLEQHFIKEFLSFWGLGMLGDVPGVSWGSLRNITSPRATPN